MNRITIWVGTVVAALAMSGAAVAVPVACGTDTAKNYMTIDSTKVSLCLASGTGNIGGSTGNDGFLDGSAGSAYTSIGKSDDTINTFSITYDQTAGTWSFSSSAWTLNTTLAIGFKWGTGGSADEWFVFSLVPGVTSGTFSWFPSSGSGGGLSHISLYRRACTAGTPGCFPPDQVPEPGTLGLLGLGLAGLGFGMRRRRKI